MIENTVARVAGFEVGELIHVIADAHLYNRYLELLRLILENKPKPAPELIIDPSVTDFYLFRKDHFKLEGYEPNPFNEKILIALLFYEVMQVLHNLFI